MNSIYTDMGYRNRAAYLKELADDYFVGYEFVRNAADNLGAECDFDELPRFVDRVVSAEIRSPYDDLFIYH